MSIVLEIYKYFGKELNIVLVYEIFKQVHQGLHSPPEVRRMFHVALQNLKFMGFFSASKSSMFLFKKNFFGKPSSYQAQNQENDRNADNK